MTRLVGIAGSLRRASYNRALLAAAERAMPDGAMLDVHPINDVPVYDADVENASGVPAVVERIKDALAGADGLILATPEYNGGIPGVLKNAIDWLSRPSADIPRVFRGLPVAMMGATPGGLGTVLSQAGWLQVLRTLRMRLWVEQGPFYVSSASGLFDDGRLTDDALRARLGDYVAAFVEHVRAHPRRRAG